MTKNIRYILALTALFLSGAAANLSAQVSFELVTPGAVEAGRAFRVEYRLVSDNEPEEFKQPSFAGVDVVAGPTVSQAQSMSIANGKTTRERSFTYTYVLQAREAGIVDLPAASVVVEGKTYTSRPGAVEVVSGGGGAQGQTPQGGAQQGTIGRDDIIVRVSTSANNVYKGEPIRVAFRLYTRVQLAGLENATYPAFNGFWTQEMDVSGYQWGTETLDDKVYQSKIIAEYLLFPQQSGTLQIERSQYTFVAQILVEGRRQSILDDFFGGPSVQQVRQNVSTPPVRITVRDLPAGAPSTFTGAVGRFTMSGGVNSAELAANSSASYDITISGQGNLPLVNPPQLTLPSSFEQYAANTTDDYRAAGSTISGSKHFSVPFIARAEGDYTIPPVEFSYFDPQAGRYNTVSTQAVSLTILPDGSGAGSQGGVISGVNKEDVKILSGDIRFIRLGDPHLREAGRLFVWSWGYVALMAVIVAAFVFALIYMRRRIKFQSDTTLVRNKHARKVADRRLKAAAASLKARDDREFYEEMARALWGYMSYKLNIPVAELSKARIGEELSLRGVDEGTAKRYVDTIAECEFARYAPSATTVPGDIYKVAQELISKLESKI